MFWARLFFPFAGAYFLSYHYRTVNAVIGPVLSDDLSFGAADLGLLTSAYFFAFGAAQLPLGLLLDRFGARRVESALLLVAAAGAAVFASGESIGTLTLGRGMIGLGVSACLMASFKSFSLWFPPERQASLTGWIMTAGTLGALVASAPVDAALRVTTWRGIFYALSVLTVLTSGWLFFCVPDEPGSSRRETMSAQLAGIRQVLLNRHFWRFAPLGFAQIGGFMAIQSLWSSAWLINVNGYSRTVAADHLAAMSVAMLVAYALIGLLATHLARRGIGTIYLLGTGMLLSLLTLMLIISQTVDQHYLLWIVYGGFSSFGTLTYSLTASGFPNTLSGRVNTTLNLMVFLGAFSLQWGLGVFIDALTAHGLSVGISFRNAFAALLAVQIAAFIWLLISHRRGNGTPVTAKPD